MNLNIKSEKENTYDAIVVGSGISGGWAAKELTEKGLKVLMLERGKNVEHVTGYETSMKHPWEFQHRGRLTAEQKESHLVQNRENGYPYTEHTANFWINDTDNPYIEIKRFDWYRGYQVGGKSLTWGRQCYRWSDIDFEANAKEGIGVDWPIRYKDIAPWYDYVEKFIGVSGSKDGLPQLPDGQFLPPMELNCVEKEVAARLKKHYNGKRLLTIGRAANLSQAQKVHLDLGRASCQYRNLCMRGCPFGAYFSTQSSTLPAAMKTGRLTLRPFSVVHSVIYDEGTGKAKGVRVVDANTKEMTEFYSRILFLNASTLGSTLIMLNSVSSRFPNGLGNDSGTLGHFLMDHHSRLGASGMMEGFDNQYYYGNRANGIYLPRYRNLGNEKRDYLRGFGFQGGASRGNWQRGVAEMGFGAGFKEEITKPGIWRMGLSGYAEMLPYFENYVFLDKNKKDAWGMPLLTIDCEFKENELKMRKEITADAVEMLEIAGVKNVKAHDYTGYPGQAKHEMGTARMGKDAKTSVLNAWNQVHAVKNVFVTDGACMTSASCVNPSLTYMALTARACDYAVKQMKRKEL
jgi:choline dehydrogenase-like flavoprotein